MKHRCKFNPNKDYVKATPNLSINLSKAMENNIVPQSGTVIDHNGLEHSSDIGPRVQDSFEAIDMQRHVMALGKEQAKANRASEQSHMMQKALQTSDAQVIVNPE